MRLVEQDGIRKKKKVAYSKKYVIGVGERWLLLPKRQTRSSFFLLLEDHFASQIFSSQNPPLNAELKI